MSGNAGQIGEAEFIGGKRSGSLLLDTAFEEVLKNQRYETAFRKRGFRDNYYWVDRGQNGETFFVTSEWPQ